VAIKNRDVEERRTRCFVRKMRIIDVSQWRIVSHREETNNEKKRVWIFATIIKTTITKYCDTEVIFLKI